MKILWFVLVITALAVASAFVFYRNKMVAPLSLEQNQKIAQRTMAEIHTSSDGGKLPYRLYVPASGDNNKKLPLVLYLHGAGGRGDDNLAQLDVVVETLTSASFQKSYPCFILAPQCPGGQEWVETIYKGLPLRNYRQDTVSETSYLKMVFEVLDKLQKERRVDSHKLYVMGYSMGATGTWDIITRHPNVFAAAVVLNGRSDPTKAWRIKDLPLMVFHGRFDRVSPLSNAQEMVAELHKSGNQVLFNKLFWGHGIPRVVLQNKSVWPWLFRQNQLQKNNDSD